jgi:hypothetical protein
LDGRDLRFGGRGVFGALLYLAGGAAHNLWGDERPRHGGARAHMKHPGSSHFAWPFSRFDVAIEPEHECAASSPAAAEINAAMRSNHGHRRGGAFGAHFGQFIRISL